MTGATGGMGRAITAAFADAGAKVMASDISNEAGNSLLAQVARLGAAVAFTSADIGDTDQVAALVAATLERFGKLDYAVNAAAIEFETVPLADCSDDDFDRMININTRGVFACMKHQIRAMLAADDGVERRAGSSPVARQE